MYVFLQPKIKQTIIQYAIREGNCNPLQHSCLENPMNGGTSWAAVHGVAQYRTQLKRLSRSSSILYAIIKFVTSSKSTV